MGDSLPPEDQESRTSFTDRGYAFPSGCHTYYRVHKDRQRSSFLETTVRRPCGGRLNDDMNDGRVKHRLSDSVNCVQAPNPQDCSFCFYHAITCPVGPQLAAYDKYQQANRPVKALKVPMILIKQRLYRSCSARTYKDLSRVILTLTDIGNGPIRSTSKQQCDMSLLTSPICETKVALNRKILPQGRRLFRTSGLSSIVNLCVILHSMQFTRNLDFIEAT